MRKLGIALACAAVVWVAASAARAAVIPIDGMAADGRNYSELAADWWEWAVSIPRPENPLLDRNGAYADAGQSGDVFFLAPSIGGNYTRSIVIEPGKSLFFPVVTSLVVNAPGETYSDAEMREQLHAFHGALSILYASIDGEQVMDLWTHRAETPVDGLRPNMPEDNIYALPMGTYSPAVGDGWWVLVEPLEVGGHQIRFEGYVGDPESPDYEQWTTYNIMVTPEPGALGIMAMAGVMAMGRRGTRKK